VDECLFAPTTVVRQAKTSGEVGGCPFRRGSLFILGLGSASKGAANRDLLFLRSELEPLSRRKVGACAIGRRVDPCLSNVA
jgi:hypothetical protein